MIKSMGGAMDAVHGTKEIVVLMEQSTKHISLEGPEQCSLPDTGRRVANRTITDLCIMDVASQGLRVIEFAPGVTAHHLVANTEPALGFSL